MTIEYIVPGHRAGVSLHGILKYDMHLSSRLITILKRQEGVFVNGRRARTIDHVSAGDLVSVVWEDESDSMIKPEDLKVDILYEDDWFIAFNKPPGMPVHPSANHQSGTLANHVRFLFDKMNLASRIRPVNRLDRDTSGVALFARHSHAQDRLVALMKRNMVKKVYLGIVEGAFSPGEGVIDLPIARKHGSLMLRVADPSGERSVTHYRTIASYDGFSLVEFILETGRTHQIRVHCHASGHPILGDSLYPGSVTNLINRQALHSHSLVFTHPASGTKISICAPLPDDMKAVLGMA